MAEEVVYDLSLNDMLTGKLQEIENAARSFHNTLTGIKDLLGSLQDGLPVAAIANFVSGSLDAYNQLQDANSRAMSSIQSSGDSVGMSFQQIQESARNMTDNVLYSQAQIMDMDAQLMTYPGITKDNFEQAGQAIADIATAQNRDIKEVTAEVGQALKNPIGDTGALRSFSDAQKQMVKEMVEGGHTMEAQKYIIRELGNEYPDAAKKAFNADPLAEFRQIANDTQVAVGELAAKALTALAPAIEWVSGKLKQGTGYIKEFRHWLNENKDAVQAVAIGLGVAAIAYGTYTAIMGIAALATTVMDAATAALDLVMLANPFVIVALALGALVGWVVYAYNHFEKFRGLVWAVWAAIKEFGSIVSDVFTGLYHTIHGALTFDPEEIASGLDKVVTTIGNYAGRIGNAAKEGYQGGVADFNKPQETATTVQDFDGGPVAPAITAAPRTPHITQPKAAATNVPSPERASGPKSITINISIAKLVEKLEIKTTNITEGVGKMQSLVANALMGAVNDSQIVASH